MKSRKDYVKAIMKYHKEYYTDGGFPTIFSLQVKMISMNICPKCGTPSRCYSSCTGHFPCGNCGLNLTENECEKITYDYDDRISDKMKKSILRRKLKLANKLKNDKH